MEQEGGSREEATEQVPNTEEEDISVPNKTPQEHFPELEERDQGGAVLQTGATQDEIADLDGVAQQEISEETEGTQEPTTDVAGGARPKIKEQLQGGPEDLMTQSAEALLLRIEQVGKGQDGFTGWATGTQKKILRQVGRSWDEASQPTGGTHGQDNHSQEAGQKLVRDLLTVVARSDLPHEEKLELEFVTLQFMMGGNVHLLGELQNQAVVEEFRQELFAKFPIPAFQVTNSVVCSDQGQGQRPEKPQPPPENGCSRQQERIYSQLIFFLCRASFLKSWDQLDRLAELLHKLKNCIYYTPVALVGVIVEDNPDPSLDPEQEGRARRWLRCLLDGFFCCDLLLDQDGTEPDVQVQVAVYQSGQPERALEVKRAACLAIRAALKF